VETALAYALTYIATLISHPLAPSKVTILADNDYYSQPSAAPSSSRFIDFGVRLSEAHKTGLGSSAALVTSFTGALLAHYLPSTLFSLATDAGRRLLHNLAQAAHCAAQGKVGSGFDVAVAVYGTCKYRRFSPAILAALGDVGSPSFAARLKDVAEDEGGRWDTECVKGRVTIPPGMALVMCDVDCGSHTPSMVKKVLAWRAADPAGSTALMDALQACNDTLEATLARAAPPLPDLEAAFAAIRARIRDMGDRSGVPIEPAEQTALLDAVTRDVPGVAGGVVPGAGGYDAIVLLVRDDEPTTTALTHFLARWSQEKGANVRLLRTKGALDGARLEDAKEYIDALA
jgi:phosphomevalonate kinase